ncbi:MAG: hypothetical protein HQ510_00885 [Candidatus Marinimicrobia bacterium]|nr:hypothetical protein [Candidatus Neomarinimicrobiota bacterium]
MGAKSFSEFKLTIGHFENRRWKKAADEMLNSRWARDIDQTPARAKRLSDTFALDGIGDGATVGHSILAH